MPQTRESVRWMPDGIVPGNEKGDYATGVLPTASPLEAVRLSDDDHRNSAFPPLRSKTELVRLLRNGADRYDVANRLSTTDTSGWLDATEAR